MKKNKSGVDKSGVNLLEQVRKELDNNPELYDMLKKELSHREGDKGEKYYSKLEAAAEGCTFEDVLVVPSWSDILPVTANISTNLTDEREIKIPIISSPMDTVTDYRMARFMAEEGGIGIIHKNLTEEEQERQIEMVKRTGGDIVIKPYSIEENKTVGTAKKKMEELGIAGLPVMRGGELVGLFTQRDIYNRSSRERISKCMTPRKDLHVLEVGDDVTSSNIHEIAAKKLYEPAKKIIKEYRVEKVPVLQKGKLIGIIHKKDIENVNPKRAVDDKGRLLVGAAIGPGEWDRLEAVYSAGADVIVLDSAHGYSKNIYEFTKGIRRQKRYNEDIQLIVGNFSTKEGVSLYLEPYHIDGKAVRLVNAIRLGQGPGGTCTTRQMAGIGVPQVTAIEYGRMAMHESRFYRNNPAPIIADGGIKYPGDITKAIAAGADSVMIGTGFAGTDEAPGEVFINEEDGRPYKAHRGMGSAGAMQNRSSAARYGQKSLSKEKRQAEGVEGKVEYRGMASIVLGSMIGGLKAGMGYTGSRTIKELKEKSKLIRVTPSVANENKPHGVLMGGPAYRD